MVAFHTYKRDPATARCEVCREKKGEPWHGPRPQCDRCVTGVHGCTGVGCYCLCMKKHRHGSGTGWKNSFDWTPTDNEYYRAFRRG